MCEVINTSELTDFAVLLETTSYLNSMSFTITCNNLRSDCIDLTLNCIFACPQVVSKHTLSYDCGDEVLNIVLYSKNLQDLQKLSEVIRTLCRDATITQVAIFLKLLQTLGILRVCTNLVTSVFSVTYLNFTTSVICM